MIPEYIEKVYEQGLDKYWECKKMTSIPYLSSNEIKGYDMYLIDGAHNYYTTYNELLLINKKTMKNCIIILHDIVKYGWKDHYYNQDSIPEEFIFGKKQGIKRAIIDFIEITSRYYYKSWRFRFPIYRKKVKTYRYSTITKEQFGLGCLEKII